MMALEELRTCRSCGKQDFNLLHVSVRHYYHHRCWLKNQPIDAGVKVLDGLYSHQIRHFPVLAVADYLEAVGIKKNALDVCKAALRRRERMER